MSNLIIKEVTTEELDEMCRDYKEFHEDKSETVQKLFETLKTTRAFNRILVSMTYVEKPNGDESVECLFRYRTGEEETVSINVTADSCIAVIQDVWKHLYEMA